MTEQYDIQGEIAARSKEGGGIKIGETWYNTWARGVTFPDSWDRGAKVRFLFTKNGRYNNVVEGKVKLLAESTGAPQSSGGGGGGGGGRSNAGPEIMSQNALTNAVALVNGQSHIFENMNLGSIVATTAKIQQVFADTTRRISKGEPLPDAFPSFGAQPQPTASAPAGDSFGGTAAAPPSGGTDSWGSAPATQSDSQPAAQSAGQDWNDDIPF